jgi:hypothetical protein
MTLAELAFMQSTNPAMFAGVLRNNQRAGANADSPYRDNNGNPISKEQFDRLPTSRRYMVGDLQRYQAEQRGLQGVGTMNAPPTDGVTRPVYDPRIDQRIVAGGPNDPNMVRGAFQGGGVGPLTQVSATPASAQTYAPTVKPPPIPNMFGSTQQNELPYWMRPKGGMA